VQLADQAVAVVVKEHLQVDQVQQIKVLAVALVQTKVAAVVVVLTQQDQQDHLEPAVMVALELQHQ
jgi:hypothetical protein